MAQPDVASKMLNDRLLADQGMLSRILVTAPDAASGTRIWREPVPESDGAIKRYGECLLDIFEMPMPLRAGTRCELEPRPLKLSPDARRLWIGFYNHVERRVGAGGELEPVRDLANKLPEHAARIAAVLTMVRHIHAGEVASAEMEAGIALAQHYATEALRLFGASRVSSRICDAQRLLDWLVNTWKESLVSLPDIYQRGPNSIREMATARSAVEVLEEHRWLVPSAAGHVVNGKTRHDVWRIIRG